MGSSRFKPGILAVLLVILAVAVYRVWPGGSGASSSGSAPTGAARSSAAQEAPAASSDVRLEALEAAPPELGVVKRNLFEFDRPAVQEEPVVSRAPAGTPVIRSGPPAPPPIPLKFIGLVEVPERALLIAVLSDERGVYHGKEGEIVEGRYRIWRINAESIEVSLLDGSGRQTIRLSGS
jgi:hypothetical protein